MRSRRLKRNPCLIGVCFCYHAKVDKLCFEGKWSSIKTVDGSFCALLARGFAIIRKWISFALMENGVYDQAGRGESVLYRHGDFGYHAEAERIPLTGRRNTIKAVKGHPCA